MNPILRLRELLDERGVAWDVFEVSGTEYVHWTNGDGLWCAASVGQPSKLHVNILNATPEQVIAATLPESDAGGTFDEERYSRVCRLLEEALTLMSEWGT